MAAQEQFVAGLVGAYDQSTLDPLVATLPEAERGALLQDAPTGMEGRKALVEKAVTAIKAQGARRGRGPPPEERRLPQAGAGRLAPRAARGGRRPRRARAGLRHQRPPQRGPTMNDWLRSAPLSPPTPEARSTGNHPPPAGTGRRLQ